MTDALTIGVLILQMHSPSWKDRARAEYELAQRPQAWPVCFQLSTCADPETACRAARIGRPWKYVWADAMSYHIKPTGKTELPELYFIPIHSDTYWHYIREVPYRPDEVTQQRECTRRWMRDMLMGGASMSEIQDKLAWGVEKEEQYYREINPH